MYSLDKKTVMLKGAVDYPVKIGERVYINLDKGTLKTSAVVCIKQVDRSGIIFETLNTNYYVTFQSTPVAAAIPVDTVFESGKAV